MGSFLSIDENENAAIQEYSGYSQYPHRHSNERRIINQNYSQNIEGLNITDRSQVFRVINNPVNQHVIDSRGNRRLLSNPVTTQSLSSSVHENFVQSQSHMPLYPRRRRQHHTEGDRICRMCNKSVPYDDFELHYAMCLTTPRVTYNDDILQADSGECSICLEDLLTGDAIARLPCLCIYHKKCIDLWFKKKQTCPEHPGD